MLEQAPGRTMASGTRGPMGNTCSGCLFLEDYTLWKWTHAGEVNKELQPVEMVSWRNCLMWERLTLEGESQGKGVRSPPPKGGRSRRDNM